MEGIKTILFLLLLVASFLLSVEAEKSKPSGNTEGKNLHHHKPHHSTHKSSPQVSGHRKATLTLNSFQKGGDGGLPSECDNKFHSDNTLVVALSTEFFEHKKRCLKSITIFGNGRRVNAKVVDECDTSKGCPHNVVDASRAVWEALGVPKRNWGQLDVFWSDA